MTERSYTVAELRDKQSSNADRMSKDVMDRLRDDNVFESHSVTPLGIRQLDGSMKSDVEPFRAVFVGIFRFPPYRSVSAIQPLA